MFTVVLQWYIDSVRLGLKVIFQGYCLGAPEEVQDDDAAHVHLGNEPSVVCMSITLNQVGELLRV